MGQQESLKFVSLHTFNSLFNQYIMNPKSDLNIIFYSFNEKRCYELIEYLTEMPPQDCTHDRGHKFPFLANQVFIDGGEGVLPIIEQFFYSKNAPRDNEMKKTDQWEIE